jgi:hypothetical protein
MEVAALVAITEDYKGDRRADAPTIGDIKIGAIALREFLVDIRELVLGDLFDSGLEAAKELAKNKFTGRCVTTTRSKSLRSRLPFSDLNDALKAGNVSMSRLGGSSRHRRHPQRC